jgi:hypothetical protein
VLAARPDPIGMSLLLTSPPTCSPCRSSAAGGSGWCRARPGRVAIGLLNLMHFSQGWVQFGYRFSNDFAPFALVLVTLAIAWLGVRPWTSAGGASVLINAWGVYWGQGW